jgi:hypothetical protein
MAERITTHADLIKQYAETQHGVESDSEISKMVESIETMTEAIEHMTSKVESALIGSLRNIVKNG